MRAARILAQLYILPVLLATAACASAPPAEKQGLALTGRVVDRADLLTPDQEKLLTAKLAALEAHEGAQFAVATTPSLQGETIEAYSLKLARAWGLGSKARNDGLMLLIAPNERRVRIEVGTGLEKTLTNDLCAQIIRDDITPRFKTGAMFDGINAGVDALITALEARGMPAKAKAA